MGYSIVGIIKDGCWKVAEFCYDISEPKAFYNKCFAPFIKNKKIIRQNISRCKFVDTLEKLRGVGELEIGNRIIEKIINLEDDRELELADARKLLDDELMCDMGYIFNFDSNTLTCYHNGKRFMFGRFEFDEINSLKKFRKVEAAYEMSMADNKEEVDEIGIKGIAKYLQKLGAVADGVEPEEAARQLMEEIEGTEFFEDET